MYNSHVEKACMCCFTYEIVVVLSVFPEYFVEILEKKRQRSLCVFIIHNLIYLPCVLFMCRETYQVHSVYFKKDSVSIIQSHCSEVSVFPYVGETFIFIIFKRDFYLLQSALI